MSEHLALSAFILVMLAFGVFAEIVKAKKINHLVDRNIASDLMTTGSLMRVGGAK